MAILKTQLAANQPAPFYGNVSDQNRFDPDCAHCGNSIKTLKGFLPAFQIFNEGNPGALVTDWRLINSCPGGIQYIMNTADLNDVNCMGGTVHSYDGAFVRDAVNTDIDCGTYYYRVTLSTGETLFSDIFHNTDIALNPLSYKLRYRHSCDLGDFCFTAVGLTTFFFEYWITNPIKAPQLEFFEDGKEDGFGSFIPSYKKLTKRLAIDLDQLNDAQVCALSVIPLMDCVELHIYENGADVKTVDLYDVQFNLTQGANCYSFGELSFRGEPHLISTLCC